MGIFGVQPTLAMPQAAAAASFGFADADMWYDFTDVTTLEESDTSQPEDGDAITSVTCKGKDGLDLSSHTGNVLFKTGGTGSQSYADFVNGDTSTVLLRSDAETAIAESSQNYKCSFVFVFYSDGAGTDYTLFSPHSLASGQDITSTGRFVSTRLNWGSKANSYFRSPDFESNYLHQKFAMVVVNIDPTTDDIYDTWIWRHDSRAVSQANTLQNWFTNSTEYLYLGGKRDATNAFSGKLYMLAIWKDSILTTDNINSLKDAVSSQFSYPDTSGYTFTVNTTTNVVTATGHPFRDHDIVLLSSTGTLPGGLSATMYTRDCATDTCKLATTRGGSAVDITTEEAGDTHTIKLQGWVDL